MAETNHEHFAALLNECSFANPAVQEMLARLTPTAAEKTAIEEAREMTVPESYQIVVTCANEVNQQALFERLSAEGYSCRLLML